MNLWVRKILPQSDTFNQLFLRDMLTILLVFSCQLNLPCYCDAENNVKLFSVLSY